MNYTNLIPDDDNTNLHLYILEPLSVIIKLAIISNKPIGTKLRMYNNIIYFQEPGPFQALCRYFLKSNKTDIQYLYNPIEIACKKYLFEEIETESETEIETNTKTETKTKTKIKIKTEIDTDTPTESGTKIKTKTKTKLNYTFTNLFKCAQNGLLKLIETYKTCSVMRICLNYYVSLISNYLEEKNNDTLFRKDAMTKFYTTDTIDKLSQIWTSNKISIVLNLTSFLSNDNFPEMNVKSLETIIDGIDKQVSQILL
jgi:hypothetical protein